VQQQHCVSICCRHALQVLQPASMEEQQQFTSGVVDRHVVDTALATAWVLRNAASARACVKGSRGSASQAHV
jgi:hypothetical protein